MKRLSRCDAMSRRGRPRRPPLADVSAHLRFEELRADGYGITKAEERMLKDGTRPSVGTRQGVRKRRIKGKAIFNSPEFAFAGFMASALLADLSYKTDRK